MQMVCGRRQLKSVIEAEIADLIENLRPVDELVDYNHAANQLASITESINLLSCLKRHVE